MNTNPTDLRGFLSYVPRFRSKLFVIDVEWAHLTDTSKAEIVMDLSALQSIGVRLVVSLDHEQQEDFLDWAVDQEFRSSLVIGALEADAMTAILGRGQAVVTTRVADELLAAPLVTAAVEMRATKMIALSDFPILSEEGQSVKFLRVEEIPSHVENLTSVHGALLQRAGEACSQGIDRVHLLDGSVPGVLLDELFSNEGVGTMVYRGSYRVIRPLCEEDISELLALIGRSVRNTYLVPRSYEDVAAAMNDYAVMEVDEHVVGCVALYDYQDRGEIACLYVKHTHEGTGYGSDLVTYMERQAKQRGFAEVFALTNRAVTFFRDRMGYKEFPVDDLPQVRLAQLRQSGRDSRAFKKVL